MTLLIRRVHRININEVETRNPYASRSSDANKSRHGRSCQFFFFEWEGRNARVGREERGQKKRVEFEMRPEVEIGVNCRIHIHKSCVGTCKMKYIGERGMVRTFGNLRFSCYFCKQLRPQGHDFLLIGCWHFFPCQILGEFSYNLRGIEKVKTKSRICRNDVVT